VSDRSHSEIGTIGIDEVKRKKLREEEIEIEIGRRRRR
jgi:hypothetical protein